MVGKKDYPINIEPIHWERLKAYRSKLETKRKVEQMSNAKSKMKNMDNVGQLIGQSRERSKDSIC